jgi:hypothetical protein
MISYSVSYALYIYIYVVYIQIMLGLQCYLLAHTFVGKDACMHAW